MADQQQAANGGATDTRNRIKEEFASLPLDKKFASLFDMEVVALSESISYVVNNTGEVFNKVGEVINHFSDRVACEFNKATQEKADAGASESAAEADTSSEGKATSGRKTGNKTESKE